MLVDLVVKSSVCAANVRAITPTHIFVHDIALFKERHDILVECRKNIFGGEYHPKFS